MTEKNILFRYEIFGGSLSGFIVSTSCQEYYKDDEKYLEYWEREKAVCGEDDVPIIAIYNLGEIDD